MKQTTYLLGLIHNGEITRRRQGNYDTLVPNHSWVSVIHAVPKSHSKQIQVGQNLVKKKPGGSIYEDTKAQGNILKKSNRWWKTTITVFSQSRTITTDTNVKKSSFALTININRMFIAIKKLVSCSICDLLNTKYNARLLNHRRLSHAERVREVL